MKKIIMLRGLPASGKSFWAKEYVKTHQGHVKRVNKDELRNMLDAEIWSKNNEKFILEIRDAVIIKSLEWGLDVIVDDTNFHEKHLEQMKKISEITGFKGKVQVKIKDFTDVPLEVCLERDEKRENRVGSKVIMDMYNRYLKPKPKIINYDKNLPSAICVDLDGTLALFGNKNPYERDFINDIVSEPVRKIINNFSKLGYEIIIVSGRKNKFLEETQKWLNENVILYNKICMPRADNDNRKDVIIKKEIYDNEIKGVYNVIFIIDDRKQVKRMWVQEGLFVLDVNQEDLDF